MRRDDAVAPLIDDRLQEALQRFRALERTLRSERETIEREMIALTAARKASGPSSLSATSREPSTRTLHGSSTLEGADAAVAPKADAGAPGPTTGTQGATGTPNLSAAHIVIARWGDQLCSHCGGALSAEQADRRRCSRCGLQLRFDRAAAPNSPATAFACPACGNTLVGVGPGQLCYHCGHRLGRSFWNNVRYVNADDDPH